MYTNDKTFAIPAAFSDLTGKMQKYVLTTATKIGIEASDDEATKTKAQANLLRVIETLKQRGGQLVISSLTKSGSNYVLEFFCEQQRTFGDNPAVAIPALFTNVKDVDKGTITVTVTTTDYFV